MYDDGYSYYDGIYGKDNEGWGVFLFYIVVMGMRLFARQSPTFYHW